MEELSEQEKVRREKKREERKEKARKVRKDGMQQLLQLQLGTFKDVILENRISICAQMKPFDQP